MTIQNQPDDITTLSVIIPIYRQWDLLPGLIDALASQVPPLDNSTEVILVDNEPDNQEPRPSVPSWIRLVHCATKGSYAARNHGAKIARGDLLIFTDADCRPDSRWMHYISQAAREVVISNQLLAGSVYIPIPESPSPWQIFDAVRGIPQSEFVKRGYAATANLSIPKKVFLDLEGFDDKRMSGGDADFCRRARARGNSIKFLKDALVLHPARESFGALAIKARRIKGGQVASGSYVRRIFWLMRSIMPPFRESIHYLRSGHRIKYIFTAIVVRFMLWIIELHEVVRLLLKKSEPERQ